jgi:signal peptidase I
MRKNPILTLILLLIITRFSCQLLPFPKMEAYRLTGFSMEPNYHDGQVFMIESITPADLKRGDLILLIFRDEDIEFLKRLVGLPNETVQIRDGQLFINDEALDEPYEVVAPRYHTEKITLEEDEYYFLGDNRNNSADSHNFGPVKWDQILGRAIPVD